MSDSWLPTLAISLLVMFVLYRRARRLFGRQPYSVPRLSFRIALLGTVGVLMLGVITIARGGSPWIGLAIGIALGLLGSYLTRFDFDEGKLYFKPNPYIGIAIFSLLIGRLVYRLTTVRTFADQFDAGGGDPTSFQNFSSSPLTSAILFVVLGFYICFNIAVLIRGQMLQRHPHGDRSI